MNIHSYKHVKCRLLSIKPLQRHHLRSTEVISKGVRNNYLLNNKPVYDGFYFNVKDERDCRSTLVN